MRISFNKLRAVKHMLPTGSIKKMAGDLGIEEQTVRNYFGANKFDDGDFLGKVITPGPDGGIVDLPDTRILDEAIKIIKNAGGKIDLEELVQ